MIIYEHTFPFELIVIAVAASLLLGLASAWFYLPRKLANVPLIVLYLIILLGLGWCLLLPGLKDQIKQLRKPRFIVAVDTSQSMSLTPEEAVPSRWANAQSALQQPWFNTLAGECDIEILPFSTEVSDPLSREDLGEIQPEGNSTLLREALRKIADRSTGLNVEGMLVLTDGHDTYEALDDWAELERPFPLYTARLEPVAAWQQEPDLRVDAVTTLKRVTVGWKSELKVRISGQGTRGAPVSAQLFRNDELLAEMPTQIPDEGGERELTFDLDHPEVGSFKYRVFLPALEDEKNTKDNDYEVGVEVGDAKLRLLYVEGIPRWEYKFIRRVLLANEQITPVIFFTGADGAPVGGTPIGNTTADMTPEQLGYFKIVMLGNLDAEELGETRAQNLTKFVEDGGSLVLLGGTKAWDEGGLLETDLGKTLPVRANAIQTLEGDNAYPVRLSSTALSHPAFQGDPTLWENIPPVLSLFTGFTESAAAETLVLAETASGPQPMVVSQRFGQGKVAVILTDSLWRWRLDPNVSETKPYDRFWGQLISWLLPREDSLEANRLRITADRDQVFFGEKVEIQARLGGDSPPPIESIEAVITFPDDREVPYGMSSKLITLPSGKSFPGHAYEFAPKEAGLHTVVASAVVNGETITSDPFSLYVKSFSPETVPRPARLKILQSLANASGGQYFETMDELNSGLSNIEVRATEETSSEFRSLWREWVVVILLMVLIAASWVFRKTRNMP
ncbi:MAG: glutamine amidotransferase [Verrucomicrobiota bacterium]